MYQQKNVIVITNEKRNSTIYRKLNKQLIFITIIIIVITIIIMIIIVLTFLLKLEYIYQMCSTCHKFIYFLNLQMIS